MGKRGKEQEGRQAHRGCQVPGSAATADIYARLRPGTDGRGHQLRHREEPINEEYVKNYTDASYIVNPAFQGAPDLDGVFSGLTGAKYDKATWGYEMDANGIPKQDLTLQDPMCVYQLLTKHYSRYTIKKVSEITGCDAADLEAVCEAYTATYKPELSGTIMYAMGTTQHTYGSQNVRAFAVLQLLRATSALRAAASTLRGEQRAGSTDHGLFHLTGYLKYPRPALAVYNEQNTPKNKDPKSLNWWGNTPKYMASPPRPGGRTLTSRRRTPTYKIDDGRTTLPGSGRTELQDDQEGTRPARLDGCHRPVGD